MEDSKQTKDKRRQNFRLVAEKYVLSDVFFILGKLIKKRILNYIKFLMKLKKFQY